MQLITLLNAYVNETATAARGADVSRNPRRVKRNESKILCDETFDIINQQRRFNFGIISSSKILNNNINMKLSERTIDNMK